MKALVLAAGVGSRLGDLTTECPKPMLEVAGRPILAHILSNLAAHGFREVAVNLHHLPRAIPDHFGDGAPWGVRLTYVQEDRLLGTAGSLKNLEAFFRGEEAFLVHYGDILTDQDLGAMLAFHRERRADATLLLHARARSNSIVVLGPEGRVERLLERPDEEQRRQVASPWVNSGVYLFGPRILEAIPAGACCDLPRDILPGLIPGGRVFGFPLTGYRCAIDSAERLRQAREDLASRDS